MEANDFIGVGERYHAPFMYVCNVIRIDDAGLSAEQTLRLAVKSVSDTMNADGLVQSMLVYGCLPRFSRYDGHHREA